MSDIVERLLASADACEYTVRSKLLREVADEIKKLTTALAIENRLNNNRYHEIERLRAQSDEWQSHAFELRASLREIANGDKYTNNDLMEIARAALEGDLEGEK